MEATPTRDQMIMYLVDWATKYKSSLETRGTCGFGRPCVGIIYADQYLDLQEAKERDAYREGGEWWQPEDAYHKHDCLAVLAYPHDEDGFDDSEAYDKALRQLYEWVKWLDAHGYSMHVDVVKRNNEIELWLKGPLQPKLVKSD